MRNRVSSAASSSYQPLANALADRYRIERQLGQGGMATVYLAYDIKHDRKVAVKVLKPELAAVLGAERFVVEIKTTAALQHPHILPLFDSGTADGFLYYVMPFIDGETLRQRLDRETQLGVDDAVRITTQVADALDYAHRRGVIHRDIKPENILLHDGRPMVADFGIALAVSAAAGGRMTETGLSLGTPHYMSPEQATADKDITGRSDIYSLASVLYEMLTGNPPHTGASAQQIIMKIIAEPAEAVTKFRKSVPPNVANAVGQALEKLPADRFATAREFAQALSNAGFVSSSGTNGPAAGARRPRTWNRVTVATAAIAAMFALLYARTLFTGRDATPASPVVRFALSDDPQLRIQTAFTRSFAVSPDGGTIIFSGTDSVGMRLWMRRIDEPRARPLPGTVDGLNATFSPNGEWVAFISSVSEIKKFRVGGGDVVSVCRFDSRSAAVSWGPNDEIFFETIGPALGIHRVSANGGVPELAIPIDSAGGEVGQRRPLVLRNSGIIAYGSYQAGVDEASLVLYRLSDGRRTRLGLPALGPLALIDNRLVYSRADGTLMAVELDVAGMRAVGRAVPLEPRVTSAGTGSAVGLSEGGTLVYRPIDASTISRLELVDTTGRTRSLNQEFAVQGFLRFAPDGKRIAMGLGPTGRRSGRADEATRYDLWVVDVATGEPTRVTSNRVTSSPAWMPDGARLVHTALVGDKSELWSSAIDGSGTTRLVETDGDALYMTVHPDGASVILTERIGRTGQIALMRRWLDGSKRVDTLVEERVTGVRPMYPRSSPDGRFVTFVDWSNSAVYVKPLTRSSALQVSVAGSNRNPSVWSSDSRHLYYSLPTGLVVIELETSPSLRVVRRHTISSFPYSENYDVAPDGRTFALVAPLRGTADVFVAVNWATEARRAWSGAGK
jgi:Tol biopolymer transport system component/tRNA A-37 threonylcarbamoyl transferase component Bud32